MAKPFSSVIGVDLGRHAVKAVLMQRKGGRYVISNYEVLNTGEELMTSDQIGDTLIELFKKMGGSARACAISISSGDALIRIIEQPKMELRLLRDALRVNDMHLLNQSARDYVLDCDVIGPGLDKGGNEEGGGKEDTMTYLVGGIPRARVGQVHEGVLRSKCTLAGIELAPISGFNAFEVAKPEVFHEEAFVLLDIGHRSSTVTVGVKGELILVRTIDFGGAPLMEALVASTGNDREYLIQALDQWDQMTIEHARLALSTLTRELSSSIGFFEGRREETIARIFVSGGPAQSTAVLKVMTEELHMPVEAWHLFERCDVSISNEAQRSTFAGELVNLNVACGAAIEYLTPSK
jgi:type IV pilus assembly protein PilM